VPVLVGGRRCKIVGAVTMDQLMVDLGPPGAAGAGPPGPTDPGTVGRAATAEVGDEVVFIGRQQGDEITANEWASLLGTIGYEITTRLGPRVPRIVVGGAA
jgi:alanine racemase